MTNHRLTKRGAEPWVVIDISLLAVPLAIIGARIYHVLTHWDFYFGEGAQPAVGALHLGGRHRDLRRPHRRRDRRLARLPVDRHPLLDLRRRPRPRPAARAGDRPLRQLVQPGAVRPADRPAVGSRDRQRQPRVPAGPRPGHAVPPDVPLRGHLERPRRARAAVGRPPLPAAVGPPVRASTWSGTAPDASCGSRSASTERDHPRPAHQRLGRDLRRHPRHRDLLRAEAASPRIRAVALRARPRVEARRALYNRRTPTTSSTSANPRRPKSIEDTATSTVATK